MAESSDSPLFGFGEDWELNACLNISVDNWWAYAEGYGRAVDVLVGHVGDRRGDLDILVYPILFNARHSLELRLKHLHRDLCGLQGLKYVLPGHHDVSKLWQMARPLVIAEFPGEDHEELGCIDRVAVELGLADRGSFTFRYPVDKSGGSSIDSSVRAINVREFYDRYSRAARLLDGIHAGVDQHLEYKEDMESDSENEW